MERDLFREELDELLPYIEDWLRSDEMNTEAYVRLFTNIHRSEKQYARYEVTKEDADREALQQAWNELQAVPSYIERYRKVAQEV